MRWLIPIQMYVLEWCHLSVLIMLRSAASTSEFRNASKSRGWSTFQRSLQKSGKVFTIVVLAVFMVCCWMLLCYLLFVYNKSNRLHEGHYFLLKICHWSLSVSVMMDGQTGSPCWISEITSSQTEPDRQRTSSDHPTNNTMYTLYSKHIYSLN